MDVWVSHRFPPLQDLCPRPHSAPSPTFRGSAFTLQLKPWVPKDLAWLWARKQNAVIRKSCSRHLFYFVLMSACIHLSGNSMSMSSGGMTTPPLLQSQSMYRWSALPSLPLFQWYVCDPDLSEAAFYSPVSSSMSSSVMDT